VSFVVGALLSALALVAVLGLLLCEWVFRRLPFAARFDRRAASR
jgi:hypothetical protein